jgi:hypothetical protein
VADAYDPRRGGRPASGGAGHRGDLGREDCDDAPVRPDPPQPATPERLHWLFDKREPPPDTWVGLAAYTGGAHTMWCNYRALGFLSTPFASEDVLTLSVGRLVLQTLAWTPAENTAVRVPAGARRFILEVWPCSDVVQTWPPAGRLDDHGLLAFARNFG